MSQLSTEMTSNQTKPGRGSNDINGSVKRVYMTTQVHGIELYCFFSTVVQWTIIAGALDVSIIRGIPVWWLCYKELLKCHIKYDRKLTIYSFVNQDFYFISRYSVDLILALSEFARNNLIALISFLNLDLFIL